MDAMDELIGRAAAELDALIDHCKKLKDALIIRNKNASAHAEAERSKLDEPVASEHDPNRHLTAMVSKVTVSNSLQQPDSLALAASHQPPAHLTSPARLPSQGRVYQPSHERDPRTHQTPQKTDNGPNHLQQQQQQQQQPEQALTDVTQAHPNKRAPPTMHIPDRPQKAAKGVDSRCLSSNAKRQGSDDASEEHEVAGDAADVRNATGMTALFDYLDEKDIRLIGRYFDAHENAVEVSRERLPAAVLEKVVELLRFCEGLKRPEELHACVRFQSTTTTAPSKFTVSNVEGNKVAHRTCTNRGEPCLYVDDEGRFVLRPILTVCRSKNSPTHKSFWLYNGRATDRCHW